VTPERWRAVREIFAGALEEPAGAARGAFLARACADEPALRAEVEAMLDAAAASASILDASPEEVAAAVRLGGAGRRDGRTIGPYRILREVGRGGMGTVYLAEREDVRKRVALKVVRGELGAPEKLERFLLERRILARLEHPGIARLLDAGVTDDGTPWFAMEYVDGEPLTDYADRRRLPLGARLELFSRACAAVAYAHRSLLVHRDVKPSNILVSADGELKLVDFGIAKLLDGEEEEGLTGTGMRLLTPDYAAPEQLRGEPVTTATDVYALGLVLYELLTGHRAFRASSRTLGEVERLVLYTEPRRPSSAVLRRDAADPAEVARARGTEPARLRRGLAGDLDAIVLKALRKEPAERYASVEALAEELERHRRRLPVLARRGSHVYRMRKFAERHRGGVAAAAVVLLAAGGAGLRERVLRGRAERLRDEANVQAAKAEQVSDFLVGLFGTADPFSRSAAGADTLRLRDFLVQRGERVLTMDGQPEVKLQALNTLGRMYFGLGLDDRARPVLDSALALARRLYPAGHLEVVRSLHNLAEYHRNRSDYEEGERDFREALAIGRPLLGDTSAEVLATLTGLGDMLRTEGKYAEAEPVLREALETETSLHGPRSLETAHVQNNLGLLLWESGRYAEAEPMLRSALSTFRDRLPPRHPEITSVKNNLGILLSNSGRAEEAEPLLREALESKRHTFGPVHRRVAIGMVNLAATLARLGRLDEAERNARGALDIGRRLYGDANLEVGTLHRELGAVFRQRGKLAEAEREARSALRIHRALLPPAQIQVGRDLVELGRVLVARGSPAEALPLLQRGDSIYGARLGEESRGRAGSRAALGACLAALGRDAGAEPLLRGSVESYRRRGTIGDPTSQEAVAALVGVYERTGRGAEAARYRALLRPPPPRAGEPRSQSPSRPIR
jgi:serine/threonine-protein kinase